MLAEFRIDESISYQYDVEGRKIESDGIRYYYDGTHVLQENIPHAVSGWNLGGDPIAIYTLAPGEVGNIISVRRSSADYFYHYDGMGNVLFLTDSAGNKAAEYVMEGFGKIIYSSGSVTDAHHLSAKEYDSNSELYYFMARWYYPKMGDFLSIDPIPSNNLYSYCGQNPINRIDPLGMKWGTLDFLLHYWAYWLPWEFNAGTAGSTVFIEEVGLLGDYRRASSVIAAENADAIWLMTKTLHVAKDDSIPVGKTIQNEIPRREQYTVDLTDYILVLGHGILNSKMFYRIEKYCSESGRVCASGNANVSYFSKDSFDDLTGLAAFIPRWLVNLVESHYTKGTPYDINVFYQKKLNGCNFCK